MIVPIYKVEPYLRRCVDSILRQTFPDFEMILVDDGSPDGCGAICDEYARADARVRVIHKSNGGLSSARNAGIETARGEWLAFVDSDDWIDPDMLAILHTAALKYDAQIAECSFRRIFRDGVREETACTGACITGTRVDAVEGMYDWKRFKTVAWDKLYHRSVIGTIRYPVGKLHEDEFTTYRYFWNAKTLVFVDASEYNYDCSREDSIMTQNFREGHLDACFAFRERMMFLRENGVDRLEEKAIANYCYILFDRLYKAYRAGMQSPKLDAVLEMAQADAADFLTRPISSYNREMLEILTRQGLRAFGQERDRQEGRPRCLR